MTSGFFLTFKPHGQKSEEKAQKSEASSSHIILKALYIGGIALT
jgi:hypothetical protein